MSSKAQSFYARGKLLLTGEYFVLDGALAIGLPTRPGQWLRWDVSNEYNGHCHWRSLDADGQCWFEGLFELDSLSYLQGSEEQTGQTLARVLQAARSLQPGFLRQDAGIRVETALEFPRLWGLGSSSTLLSNLARWAGVDVYELSSRTFGGSGYDLAAATAEGPFWYQKGASPLPCPFAPPFADQLAFVYLGHKQNSREGIQRYRALGTPDPAHLQAISDISRELPGCTKLGDFIGLLRQHEDLVANTLQLKRVQTELFPEFPGLVKSLGAWGGDFVLACSEVLSLAEMEVYFNEKGHNVFFKYADLIR